MLTTALLLGWLKRRRLGGANSGSRRRSREREKLTPGENGSYNEDKIVKVSIEDT